MSNYKRRESQVQVAFWVEKDFKTLMETEFRRRRTNRSQFFRDAVAEKFQRDFGTIIPEELIVPLPPYADHKNQNFINKDNDKSQTVWDLKSKEISDHATLELKGSEKQSKKQSSTNEEKSDNFTNKDSDKNETVAYLKPSKLKKTPIKYRNNPVSEQMVAEDQSEYGKPKKPAKIEIDPANLYDDPEKPGKSLSGMKLVEYYPNKYKIRVGTPENPVKIFGTKDHWDEGETILIEGEGRMSKDDYIKMVKEQQIQKSIERFNRNVKKMMGAEDEDDSDDNSHTA